MSSKKKVLSMSDLRKMIRTYDDPALKQQSVPIDISKQEDRELTLKTIDTMKRVLGATELGVGLAAIQIGKPLQIFITKLDKNKFDFKVFINPEIVSHNEEVEWLIEGCLSYPKVFCPVKRFTTTKVKYINDNFELREEEYSGFASRVIQHEIDHFVPQNCQVGKYWEVSKTLYNNGRTIEDVLQKN